MLLFPDCSSSSRRAKPLHNTSPDSTKWRKALNKKTAHRQHRLRTTCGREAGCGDQARVPLPWWDVCVTGSQRRWRISSRGCREHGSARGRPSLSEEGWPVTGGLGGRGGWETRVSEQHLKTAGGSRPGWTAGPAEVLDPGRGRGAGCPRPQRPQNSPGGDRCRWRQQAQEEPEPEL